MAIKGAQNSSKPMRTKVSPPVQASIMTAARSIRLGMRRQPLDVSDETAGLDRMANGPGGGSHVHAKVSTRSG